MATAIPQVVIDQTMIIRGTLFRLESALAAGADPNRPIDFGGPTSSPLAIAALFGKEDIFKLLITNGAAFLDFQEESISLNRAASDGHLEIVRILLEAGRVDVNSLYQERLPAPGMTPLMCAAIGGQADMVDFLLKAGADANITPPENGLTSLDCVFIGGSSAGRDAIVLKLLDAGCKAYKQTPLMYAASEGRLNLLVELISGCSTIHGYTHRSYPEKPTALHQARDADIRQFMLVEIRKREKYTAAALSVMPYAVPEVFRRKIIGLLRRW